MTSTGHSSGTSATGNRPRHESSLTDIRNQVTMVSGGRAALAGNSELGNRFPDYVDKSSITLPFVAGDYEATEVLARGGMSTTYIGHCLSDATKKVVIKVPDVKSKKTVDMFSNECKILAELEHSNIVPILSSGDFIQDGMSYPYMVMKFIEGQSLRQKIKAQGRLGWEEAAKVLEDVADALNYLYENNFCHRDIKPDNIIFDTETGHWILVDFGIAKSLQDNIMLTMTMAGQDSGTWDYMPPEQLDGKAVDIRCDIYALGTVVWEALIGTVPRRGTKLPAAYGLDLPADVDILIGKMVEHNPADRYQTPGELLNALHSGAGKVEKWKEKKGKLQTISRVGVIGAAGVVLISLIWVIGNFIAVAKAKEIYEDNKASPTVTLGELHKFSAKMPFFWGQCYLDEVIPDLQNQAKEEFKNMQSGFAEIRDEISLREGSDGELGKGKVLCENFIKRWENIFSASEELTKAKTCQVELSKILLRRNEEGLLNSTIGDVRNITVGKTQSQFKEAFDKCKSVEKELTLPEVRIKLGRFVAELRNAALGNVLKEVDELISSDTLENWLTADREVNNIRVIIGDDPELTEKQQQVDDKFWNYYHAEAQNALKINEFAKARASLRHYREIGMKKHAEESLTLEKKINYDEEVFSWKSTHEVIEKYVNDRAFVRALEVLNQFANQYPNTQVVKIPEQRKCISDAYADYIRGLWGTLDDFQEQLKVFLEKFPEAQEKIKSLRKCLCCSVHNAVHKIVYDSSTDNQVKLTQLAQIKYTDCEEYQKNYLKKLLTAASNFAAQESLSTRYAFFYVWQRPPADCVKMKEEPTIYDVTITRITVNLSWSHYNELRGDNNSDPVIKIGKVGYEPWWSDLGPVNNQAFTLTVNHNFLWNIKDCELLVQIADDDFFAAQTYSVAAKPTIFKRSDTAVWKFENGTTLEIQWTTK